MLWLKVLAPIITLAAALLKISLQYKWSDKGSKQHYWISRFLIFLIILGTIATVFIVYQDDKSTYSLQNTVDDIKEQHANEIKAATEREKNAIKERAALQNQLVDMNLKIDPFIELAKTRYPKETIDSALQKLIDDISKLENKTDIIKEKTDLLEQTIRPRSLKQQDFENLVSVLNRFEKREIGITCVMGDQEAFAFATQLKSLFEKSGWKVKGVSQSVFTSPVKGWYIAVNSDPPPETANIVFRAFQSIGITLPGFRNESLPNETVEILVGSNKG